MANCTEEPDRKGKENSGNSSSSKLVGRWVLFATILGSGMAFIDGTAINIALPILQNDLDASVVDVQWVVEAYALFVASLILVGGSMGDKFGRRLIYSIGIGIFAVSSIFCGLSQNVEQLITARTIQGIGGAMLIPGSLSIIVSFFKDVDRGKAIGTWSGFSTITAAIGPVLGGWLVENFSWRWIFFINLPIAIIVMFILFWRVPESRDEQSSKSLDFTGAIFATIGLGGIVFGLLESSVLGFSNKIVLSSIVLGTICLITFVIVESRIESPIVRLSLFRSSTFSGTNLITFFLYSALGGAIFFIPFDFILVQGYTPTEAGAAFLPLILLIFLFSRPMGQVVDRYGAKIPLIIGPIVTAVGYILFSIPGIGGNYWTTFFPAIVVLGLGMAICVAPLTTAVMISVDIKYSGTASGINNAVSRVAGLIAIAIFGIIILSIFNNALDTHLETIQIEEQLIQIINDQRIKLAAVELPLDMNGETSALLRSAINDSFINGIRYLFYISAGLSFVSAVIAIISIKKDKSA